MAARILNLLLPGKRAVPGQRWFSSSRGQRQLGGPGFSVREVRAWTLPASEMGADYHRQAQKHWITDTPIANPMSKYEKYRASRTSWGIGALGTVVVEVELHNGLTGVGTSIGGPPAAYIVEQHLSRFVEGQDCRKVELIWDQMWRATMPYGRKGLPVHALSAVDLALWDCLGKAWNEPVYNLIGGSTKDDDVLPVYGTTCEAANAHDQGFVAAKVPLPYGPAQPDSLRRNVEFISRQRASIPDNFRLMIDCYMSLDVAYAVRLALALQPYDIYWLEEFLPPDNIAGYAEVRRQLAGSGARSMMLTCGEHEYTRYGFRQLIESGAVDVLQPDVNWVGGLTECKRIVALAQAYDLPVIPHGSSVFSYHMQLANTNCPMAEFLVMSPEGRDIVPLFGNLFTDEPLPSRGAIKLDPSKPGWGVTLNRSLNLERLFPQRNA